MSNLQLQGRKVFKVFNQDFIVDDRYTVTKELGQGAYGIVWYVPHRHLCSWMRGVFFNMVWLCSHMRYTSSLEVKGIVLLNTGANGCCLRL